MICRSNTQDPKEFSCFDDSPLNNGWGYEWDYEQDENEDDDEELDFTGEV